MKNKSVFWGILLISVGILWILKSLGTIDFSWCLFIKLWPLIFIWVGIKFLPIADKWKIILNTLILFCGIAFLLIYSNSNCCDSKWKHFSICSKEWYVEDEDTSASIENQSIIKYEEGFENAHLDLSASAGKLVFKTGDELIAIREIESSGSKINIISKIEDDNSVKIKAEVHPFKSKRMGKNSHKYNVFLSSAPVWEMELDLSATAGEIDLSAFKVKELEIESNASALELKLGNLFSEVNVKIESNASSVEIAIPKNMKCFLQKKGSTLSSINVKGLTKENNSRYASNGDDETAGVVNITIETNVSSVEVKRY